MRFVPIKSTEAQSVLMLHRARHLLVRQRTAQVSAVRGHLAEYGIVAAKDISRVRDLPPVLDAGAGVLPELARQTLLLIAQLIEALTMQIRKIETELLAWHRSNPASQRLETIPGVGVISPPPPWPPPFSMRRRSDQAASSPPGSGWCRGRTPAAARIGWAASPRWATATCGICSSSVPPRSCATRGGRRPPSASGQTACSTASRPGWSPSPSPTRWPGSPGRSVSLRRGPPFLSRRDRRGLDFDLRRGDGKCPQVWFWAQVWESGGVTDHGLRL